ncbi:MAG TPA: zinc-ribbon domain-containing protein [Casimicrobiaceae bacterium]|nr:zinc-ribbon domain-containing protein [Casimicrobiaceae bacterium]
MTSGRNGGDRRTTCPACGKRVVAGARYCIHCGAEQDVPTPIAAVAAASLAKTRAREAANAAHADPAPRSRDSQRKGAVATFPKRRASAATGDGPRARPAYDDAPSRRRLAGALVVAGVLVAVASAAVIGTRFRHEPSGSSVDAATGTSAAPNLTTVNAESAPATTPTQSAQAATPPEAPVQTTTENPLSTNAPDASAAAAQPAADASAPAAPIEIKPLPPHPATSRAAHRASSTKTASAAEQPREQSSAVVSEPVQRAPPVAPTHVATQSAVSHPRDRWARMDDDLARCTREDFIARVVCGQRVRFHYCSGYWGKVSQCPGSPAPEHGQ